MHECQKKILDFLKKKPNATYSDIAKGIKAELSGTIIHHVKQLVDKGYLKRNPRWQVTRAAAKVLEGK